MNGILLRQVNCYQQPERLLVEAFRLLVFGILVNPMPKPVYDALWSTATFAEEERREWFEAAFSLYYLQIGEFEFVVTSRPEWFIEYNAEVEAGEAPVSLPCPCNDF